MAKTKEADLPNVDLSPISITSLFDGQLAVPPIHVLPPSASGHRKRARIGLFAVRDALQPPHLQSAGPHNSWLVPLAIGALVTCASCASVAEIALFLLQVLGSYLLLTVSQVVLLLSTCTPRAVRTWWMLSDDTVEGVMSMMFEGVGESEPPLPSPDAQRRYAHNISLARLRYLLSSTRVDYMRGRPMAKSAFPPYPTDAGGAPIHNLDAWGDF